jgi:protein-histidine pros-kinase
LNLLVDLSDLAPDAAVVIDRDGVIVAANSGAEALWQRNPIGARADTLAAVASCRQLDELRVRCTSQDVPVGATLLGVRADGAEFPVEFRMRQLRLSDGIFLWAFARPAQETIEILANTAHDLRGSLNAVIGFAEFVGDEKPGPLNALQKEYVLDILGGGRMQLQLVNDLVQLVKLEAGRVELQAVNFRLEVALAEVQAAMAAAAAATSARLRVESQPVTVTLDRDKVIQILRSLAGNSLELAGDAGEVRISARLEPGARVLLQVRADRHGADREQTAAVAGNVRYFDERLVRTGSAAYLNLAATRKLAEFMGGSLTLGSSPNLLTTLCSVSLPMVESSRVRHGE